MQQRLVPRVLAFLLALLPPAAPAADIYWGLTYRNIDVTAEGTSAYAVNLARYCVRLDALLTRILGIKTSTRIRTQIYALSAGELTPLIGTDTVSNRASPVGNTRQRLLGGLFRLYGRSAGNR
jgi:hypothetical protein